MEWIVLGSGTAVPHAQRGSAAHLLVGGGVAALLDAGSGCKDRLARFGVPLGSLLTCCSPTRTWTTGPTCCPCSSIERSPTTPTVVPV